MARCLMLEQLPIEILGAILRTVPDVTTLLALISASPQFFRLYSSQKDQVCISVISNQLGDNLTNALHAIPRCSPGSIPYWRVSTQPSLDEARLLYKHDQLFNLLIQHCVDLQLNTDVQLSEIEWFRMRRGMYNYAAIRSSKEQDFTQMERFCQTLSPKEILEVLYILHCLRDLAADHIMRLEDLIVEKNQQDTWQAGWRLDDPDWSIFERSGDVLQTDWLENAPWSLSTQEFLDLTLPADLKDALKFDLSWADYYERQRDQRVTCDEVLRDMIPSNYLFDQSSFPGISPYIEPDLDPALLQALFTRSVTAIPMGYMMWDEQRLEQMFVKDVLEKDVDDCYKVRWQRVKCSVESRVFELVGCKNQGSGFPDELRHIQQ